MKIRIEKNRVIFRSTYYDFSMNIDFIYLYCNKKSIKYVNWIYSETNKSFIEISKNLYNKKFKK